MKDNKEDGPVLFVGVPPTYEYRRVLMLLHASYMVCGRYFTRYLQHGTVSLHVDQFPDKKKATIITSA